MGLFQPIPSTEPATDPTRPLADRLRPRTLDEYVGQEHLLGLGKPLRTQIERDDTGSLIFWGPSRNRQDHAGKDHCEYDEGGVY